MNKSDSITALAKAMAKAQGVIEGATKDATNPHFRAKYATLASVVEAAASSPASATKRDPQAAAGSSLHSSSAPHVSPAMVRAGLRILRESGALFGESSSDDLLVRRILDAALAVRKGSK